MSLAKLSPTAFSTLIKEVMQSAAKEHRHWIHNHPTLARENVLWDLIARYVAVVCPIMSFFYLVDSNRMVIIPYKLHARQFILVCVCVRVCVRACVCVCYICSQMFSYDEYCNMTRYKLHCN